MTEIRVDHEKLAYGLEKGIGNTRTIFASLPAEKRLRLTPCGLVSTAIHHYAQQEDITSRLVLSRPKLAFDPHCLHAIPLLGSNSESAVVDASPSQFLGYAGLDLAYEKHCKVNLFPPEKIIDFPLDEAHVIVDWLTKHAIRFQTANIRPQTIHGRLGEGPLSESPETAIREAYAQVWNQENFMRWTPPTRVQEDGRVACASIPKGAFEV